MAYPVTVNVMPPRSYIEQVKTWPTTGEHILANFDETSITVYQAYKVSIAEFAVKNQRLGGEFSYERMSWVKPNFLWMMYRSGWATKVNQENILAIRINRSFFDEILRKAVVSSFEKSNFSATKEWQTALKLSDVRLQWDPDHHPSGARVGRRAVQLGLRGQTLQRFGNDEIISIENITDFVAEQRGNAVGECGQLMIPCERIYVPRSSTE